MRTGHTACAGVTARTWLMTSQSKVSVLANPDEADTAVRAFLDHMPAYKGAHFLKPGLAKKC